MTDKLRGIVSGLPSMDGHPPKEEGIEGLDIDKMKPRVASAVRSLRDRMPTIRPNGIFKHPPDWTDEEIAFIADCLKQNIPIYTIAHLVHCERGCLSRLIAKTPELKELKENKYENILDEAEYQADKLAKGGNASIVMFILQTLGKKRGWSTQEMSDGNKDDDSRIIMGEIPVAEVEKAEEHLREIRGESGNPGGLMTDPMALAAVEETVKAEVEKQVKAATPEVIDVEDVKVSKPVYEQSGVYGNEDGGVPMVGEESTGWGGTSADDPWASGSDSMYFQ